MGEGWHNGDRYRDCERVGGRMRKCHQEGLFLIDVHRNRDPNHHSLTNRHWLGYYLVDKHAEQGVFDV